MLKKYIIGLVALCFLGSVCQVLAQDNAAPGEYKRYLNGKPDSDQASIKISQLKDGRFRVKGNAVWVGNVATGDVNLGELNGIFPLNGHVIHYTDGYGKNSCKLTITFLPDALQVNNDNMHCGGLNVTFDGYYKKTKAEQPNQFAHEFYAVFYANYKEYFNNENCMLEDFNKLFTPKNYFSPQLTRLLIDDEKRRLASVEIVGLDFDPFVDAQDNVNQIIIGEIKNYGAKKLVTVTFPEYKNHKIILELLPDRQSFIITNIFYPDEKTDLLKLFSVANKLPLSKGELPR